MRGGKQALVGRVGHCALEVRVGPPENAGQTQLPSGPAQLSALKSSVQVTFWHALSGNLQAELQTLTDQFNSSQTNVHVALVAKGAAGALFFATDDCRTTFEELKGRGVEFQQEPTDQPYGIDAAFRDPSGNQARLVQNGTDVTTQIVVNP